MESIFNILQEGGEALLLVLASHPVFTSIEITARNKKWAPYMHDFKNAISPYYDSPDPEGVMRSLLTNVGFLVKDCRCMPKISGLPVQEFFQSIKAVDPFSARIPEHLVNDYYDDRRTVMWKEKLASYSEETDKIFVSYTLITVHAEKPILNQNNLYLRIS